MTRPAFRLGQEIAISNRRYCIVYGTFSGTWLIRAVAIRLPEGSVAHDIGRTLPAFDPHSRGDVTARGAVIYPVRPVTV